MGILKLKKNGKGGVTADPTPDPPSEADLDAVAEEEKAKEATAPPTTPSAEPKAPEQSSVHGAAPESAMPASFLTLDPTTNWSDPKRDTSKLDSLGNEKTDPGEFGPKGSSLPPDVQTDDQRKAAQVARDAALAKNQADTFSVDSIGNKKGRFVVTPQGHDSHGMRLPDQVDYSQIVEEHIPHGPRGKGVPKDTFHRT